jgi:putative DNA methylase
VIDKKRAEARRTELFALIEELVRWENSCNEEVLGRARAEIAASVVSHKVHDTKEWAISKVLCGSTAEALMKRTASPSVVNAFLLEHGPPVHDPFCGGGSIPVEAQRLGLRAYASDLNPVPVLINKALIEIPPKFVGQPPTHAGSPPPAGSTAKKTRQRVCVDADWRGAAGLTADIRHYGERLCDEASKRLSAFYPPVTVTSDMIRDQPALAAYEGVTLPVCALIWARTVASPNPAAGGQHVPLVRSFWLSTRKGKEAWIEPIVHPDQQQYSFRVRSSPSSPQGDPAKGTVGRTGGRCLLTDEPIPLEYIRSEGRAGRLGTRLMAIVASGAKSRVFLSPCSAQEDAADQVSSQNAPDTPLPTKALSFRVQAYGMDKHWKLFTPRQLATLSTLSDLILEIRHAVYEERVAAKQPTAGEYADAIATYLGLAVSRWADLSNSLCSWNTSNQNIRALFARQAIPMSWDFAEVAPFGDLAPVSAPIESAAKAVASVWPYVPGVATAEDATTLKDSPHCVISTDPPYYDNIGYSDLSDFFYVWLRRSLSAVYPDLCSTVLTPKATELIATPYRHEGSRAKATEFFEDGLKRAFSRMQAREHPAYPMTVFYAFKQSEVDEGEGDGDEEEGAASGVASTGWESMLEGLVSAGFAISGTWPMRTERGARSVSLGTNALASSIVLVCRPRSREAPLTSRREFVAALKRELPVALRDLQAGNIAPVDLAQAAIGPGMAVYSRYSKVLESSGERLTVRTALALINQVLDEVLAEQEGDYDADTRWSLKWFEQFAHDDGPFGDANTLATAMSIGINGLVDTGIVQAKSGKVRLLKRTELMGGHPETWDPATDTDIVHWEVCQYLIHALDTKGEAGAAALLRRINARYPGASETARELAYRLYTICERKKWAQEAMAYNSLIVAWPEIVKLAQHSAGSEDAHQTSFLPEENAQ